MDVFTITILFCGMAVAAVCDLRTGKIPNLLTLADDAGRSRLPHRLDRAAWAGVQ